MSKTGPEQTVNLLLNSDFTEIKAGTPSLPDKWEYRGCPSYFGVDADAGHSSPGSASICIQGDRASHGLWCQTTRGVDTNAIYEARVWLRTEGVSRTANGAYLAIEFLDAGDSPITYHWSDRLWDDNDWTEIVVHVLPVRGTTAMRFTAGVHGVGKVWVDDAYLAVVKKLGCEKEEDGEGSRAPVGVEVYPGEIVNSSFVGVGAESDPFLWLRANRRYGLTEEDYDLVTKRIRDMRPGIVRIFVRWEGWKDRDKWGVYQWGSNWMNSLYKMLDLYQEAGTPVLLTLVDWGYDPWRNIEKAAGAAGDLMEHLVGQKGYTCVRYLTTDNEASSTVTWSFEKKKRVAELVYDELKRRGLERRVGLIEPDEERGGRSWVKRSTESLSSVLAGYSSHFYVWPEQMELVRYMTEDRVDLIRRNDPDGTKPFFIMEFEVIDGSFGVAPAVPYEGEIPLRTEDPNPLVATYEGALANAEFVISALAGGASALSFWNLFDQVYPDPSGKFGRLMTLGLWAFKHKGWEPKPVFYAYSLFTRYTGQGFNVVRSETSASALLKALALRGPRGDFSIYVLNKALCPRKVRVNMHQAEGGPGTHILRKYLFSRDAIPTADHTMLKPVGEKCIGGYTPLEDVLPGESLVLYTNVE